MSNESGWKNVSPLEAHQAWEAKTYEVEQKYIRASRNEPWFNSFGGCFGPASSWQYRIREKVATITVEMPKPYCAVQFKNTDYCVLITYANQEQRDAALSAINAAMGE